MPDQRGTAQRGKTAQKERGQEEVRRKIHGKTHVAEDSDTRKAEEGQETDDKRWDMECQETRSDVWTNQSVPQNAMHNTDVRTKTMELLHVDRHHI